MTSKTPITQEVLDEIWRLHAHALRHIDAALGLQKGTAGFVVASVSRELRERVAFEPIETHQGTRRKLQRSRNGPYRGPRRYAYNGGDCE